MTVLEGGGSAPENGAERTPEYQAVFVLGKNWRKYPSKENPGEKLHLSIESKMSAIAAAEMFLSGKTQKIYIFGGKTAGHDHPSEAGAMRDFIIKVYGEGEDAPVSPADIIAEEESVDTHENAKEVFKIVEAEKFHKVALLTVGFHMERSEQIFRNHGVEADSFSAEEFLGNRSPHYRRFLEEYEGSGRVAFEKEKEMLYKIFLEADPKGTLATWIAKKFRG